MRAKFISGKPDDCSVLALFRQTNSQHESEESIYKKHLLFFVGKSPFGQDAVQLIKRAKFHGDLTRTF